MQKKLDAGVKKRNGKDVYGLLHEQIVLCWCYIAYTLKMPMVKLSVGGKTEVVILKLCVVDKTIVIIDKIGSEQVHSRQHV